MKTLNLKPLTYEMLVELSGKKSKGDIERYLEQMIKNAYSRNPFMRWAKLCPAEAEEGMRFIQGSFDRLRKALEEIK